MDKSSGRKLYKEAWGSQLMGDTWSELVNTGSYKKTDSNHELIKHNITPSLVIVPPDITVSKKQVDIKDVFSDIGIVLYSNKFLETLYITVQLIRDFSDKELAIFIYSENETALETKRLDDISSVSNTAQYLIHGHKDSMDENSIRLYSIKQYLSVLPFKYKYTLFMSGDVWILDYKKFLPHLDAACSKNMDGLIYTSRKHSTKTKKYINVPGSSFFMIKTEYLDSLLDPFSHIFSELNWYNPYPDAMMSEFGYKADYGIGHFHHINLKRHFIAMWEMKFNKKLDYRWNVLKYEYFDGCKVSQYPPSGWMWGNEHLSVNFDDDTSVFKK